MRVTAEGKRGCENRKKRAQRLKSHCWQAAVARLKSCPPRAAGAFTQILNTVLHEERNWRSPMSKKMRIACLPGIAGSALAVLFSFGRLHVRPGPDVFCCGREPADGAVWRCILSRVYALRATGQRCGNDERRRHQCGAHGGIYVEPVGAVGWAV